MVDRDVANAITIAMIAKVIEVTVILFITFSPSLVSQSVLVFPGFGLCEPKGLFTWYFDPLAWLTELKARLRRINAHVGPPLPN